MFKSITYLKYDRATDLFYYKLVDSHFTCEASVEGGKAGDLCVVVVEYARRNLPIAKNLALLYLSLQSKGNVVGLAWLENDRDFLDQFHPELEYGTKHYHCVIRQMQQLRFSRQDLNVQYKRIKDRN